MSENPLRGDAAHVELGERQDRKDKRFEDLEYRVLDRLPQSIASVVAALDEGVHEVVRAVVPMDRELQGRQLAPPREACQPLVLVPEPLPRPQSLEPLSQGGILGDVVPLEDLDGPEPLAGARKPLGDPALDAGHGDDLRAEPGPTQVDDVVRLHHALLDHDGLEHPERGIPPAGPQHVGRRRGAHDPPSRPM